MPTKKLRKKGVTALSPQKDDPLWQMIEQKLGGKNGMIAAALATKNPKAQEFALLGADPAYRTWGSKKIAKKVGLEAPDFVDMFRDKKWLEATLVLHDELPEILKGATEDAKPSFVPCAECKGKPVGVDGVECYVCEGKGKTRRPGDKDKLSFVGEAVGMTGKRGPAVQINQQINTGQTENRSFEDLMRKATVTIGKPKQIEAVEAEVVDEGQ